MRRSLVEILTACFLMSVCSYTVLAQDGLVPVQIDSAMVTALRSKAKHGNGALYTPAQIKGTITTLGEPDILRHISSLPGVSQGMEGSLGLFVRGANNGGNRINLNGVPLSSYSHMLGLISSINPEVVSETLFSPGGIASEYGDLSSSLTEIKTKRTTRVPSYSSTSISPYMLSFTHSGRTESHKAGLLISGRGSILPYIAGKAYSLLQDSSGSSTIDGFMYDFTMQGDWNLSDRSRFDVMAYGSQDKYVVETGSDVFRLEWWSAALKAGWVFDITPKLKLDSKIFYVRSSSVQHQGMIDSQRDVRASLMMTNNQKETTIASVLRYAHSEAISMDGGTEVSLKEYEPANSILSTYLENIQGGTLYASAQLSGFMSFAYTKQDRIKANAGLRETASYVFGKWRTSLDVRLKSDVYITNHWGIECTFDKLTQFHHVLEGLPMGWSLDISIPSYGNYPEEKTYQSYVGAFFNRQVSQGSLNASLGGFYRKMNNLVSYKSSANFFRITDATWANEVTVGTGTSFGGELSLSYSSDRVHTALAYTLSKTTRQFDEINEGKDFLFRYDRPHIINLNGDLLVGSRTGRKGRTISHRINSTFAYSSGNLITMPISSYQGELLPLWDLKDNGGLYLSSLANRLARTRYEYGEENCFRMKDYIRLDLAYSIEKQMGSRISSWTISIFNVLNRHNPMLIYNNGKEFKSVSLIPIMPSLRWSYNW